MLRSVGGEVPPPPPRHPPRPPHAFFHLRSRTVAPYGSPPRASQVQILVGGVDTRGEGSFAPLCSTLPVQGGAAKTARAAAAAAATATANVELAAVAVRASSQVGSRCEEVTVTAEGGN